MTTRATFFHSFVATTMVVFRDAIEMGVALINTAGMREILSLQKRSRDTRNAFHTMHYV